METIAINSIRDLVEQDPYQQKYGLLFPIERSVRRVANWDDAPPVKLSTEGEYLCLELFVPLSNIKDYYGASDVLEVLKLDPEETMMDSDVDKALNSVYRNLVAETYCMFNTDALNKNLSVEMVDYAEGDPAVSFRFSVSSASLPGFDADEDVFDKIPYTVALRLFSPLLRALATTKDRMKIFQKVHSGLVLSFPQFDLDDAFAERVLDSSYKTAI